MAVGKGVFRGGMFWRPRGGCRDGYLYDLDASERFVRPKTGIDYFPYPPICGMISGILPLFNERVWAGMYAKNAFGPGVGSRPANLQFQITVPGLTKFDGV